MSLDLIEYLQGFSSLIFVFISIIISIKILLAYKKYRYKQLLYVGIAWIGFAMPWLSDSISFILILTFGEPISISLKVIIELAFLPFFLLLWLRAFMELLSKERKKLILMLTLIFGIVFDIILLFLVVTDVSLFGTYITSIDFSWSLTFSLYLFLLIIIIFITGIMFARNSLKSDKPEIRLKGKFLLIAFVSFTIGAILDALPILAISGVIARFILISSAIEYYFGFILPDRIKKLFLKDT